MKQSLLLIKGIIMIREINIRCFEKSDLNELRNIFNLFTNDFAVYPDFELSEEMFAKFFENAKIILILQNGESIIGYGYISSLRPFPNFNHTGVLSYFMKPEYTNKGLGTKLLNELIVKGKESGITNYLASISSRNKQSLRFHEKHGFEVTGRFKNACFKFGQPIDIIWVQKQYADQ